MNPRRITSLIAVTFPIAWTAACSFSGSFSFDFGNAEEDFSLSAPFQDVGTLSVDWQNGTILVRFDDTADEITAVGIKSVLAGSDAEARAFLNDMEITLEVAESFPAQVFLRFTLPEGLSATFSADVEVVVPSGIPLTIANVNGNITVRGNGDTTDVQVVNGSITISDQTGDSIADTTNGTIDITILAGDVVATSTNGNIDIDSMSGNVDAESTNGGIGITARPGDSGTISARTTNGAVGVFVPADTAASLVLRASLGLLDFNLQEFTITDLQQKFGELTATLNGGGGEIIAESTIGIVTFGDL